MMVLAQIWIKTKGIGLKTSKAVSVFWWQGQKTSPSKGFTLDVQMPLAGL